MENEIKFDENRRKLIRAFRAKVNNAQPASRETLLAYAFLRGRKYIDLESKINEDHPSFGEGRKSFLIGLSYQISHVISGASVVDSSFVLPESGDILKWMMEKYQQPQVKLEEKAA